MNDMKKIHALYRGNNTEEIETQKQACYNYVKLQGWEISKEFSEDNGIYEDKIDSLILIHDEALKQEIDILLVYDFNTISKDEMEIPLAVCWFIEMGIDVVSVRNEKRDFFKERSDLLEISEKYRNW